MNALVARMTYGIALLLSLSLSAAAGEFKQFFDEFVETVNAQTFDDLGKYYSDDVVLVAPGQPELVGIENAQLFWEGMFDAGISNYRITLNVVEDGMPLSVVRANYSMQVEDSSLIAEEVKGVVVFVLVGTEADMRISLHAWNVVFQQQNAAR